MKNEITDLSSDRGFTRLELVMVLATLVLLAGVSLPVLASTKSRSQQIGCFNNLRQIGKAFQLWGNEHQDQKPCRTPWQEGGTQVSTTTGAPFWAVAGLQNNVYFQFYWLSNELGTPKILACPADDTVRMAKDFSANIDGGFFHPTYKNRAVSYLLGTHAFFDYPQSLLSGDRNIKFTASNQGCSAGIQNAYALSYQDTSIAWTNRIHGEAGNLLSDDGQVQYVARQGLQTAVTNTPGNANHYLAPTF